jgi:predicted secreted protein
VAYGSRVTGFAVFTVVFLVVMFSWACLSWFGLIRSVQISRGELQTAERAPRRRRAWLITLPIAIVSGVLTIVVLSHMGS